MNNNATTATSSTTTSTVINNTSSSAMASNANANCIFNLTALSGLQRTFSDIQSSMDLAMLCLSACAVFLNASVIHCATRLIQKNFDTIHVYIISMTAADLLIVLCMVLESMDRLFPLLSHVPCSCLHFLGWMCWTASGLSLVLLNSDKLLFFCFPLQYRIMKSVRRAVKLCVGVWLLSFCFVAYVWLARVMNIGPNRFSPRCSASLNPSKLHIFTFYTLLVCVLPILSSLVVSCYLIRLMRIKRRPSQQREQVHLTSSTTSESCSFTQAPAFTRKLRSLVFIFITTVWTASSLLPYRVLVVVQYKLLAALLADKCGWLSVWLWLSQLGWLLHYLLKLNPIVNPFITALIYHPYRTEFAKTLIYRRLSNVGSRSTAKTAMADL